ncbi:ABC transporter ATP-binding protein [Alcanivorax nanhaiticus]|uniref:ABC transporter ATP-binding protein n=1 Tax=Alcanivorax nanhaiticus TaxID=1177154 RepID=A0A095SG53_9GAMM|nr:ABC transporter ATP-binding protein [Alcanivorax nanhaiticus]KGD63566.1 ABC transporter ATP-binding protein [Alcanivorax nanhaiticus]
MAVLEARNLVVDIPGREGGHAFSARVLPGQRWGVLGPNGAGKTSLLHTLAGLRPARSGEVLLDGQSLSGLTRRAVAQKLAVVFQERQDSFPATVLETALVGRHPFLSPWQRESAEDLRLANGALERLSLSLLKDRLVSTLSGGERQRVSIATALTQQPAIWLADEPTNHLDLHHQVAVMALLNQQAEQGAAVFMCLHDLNLAARWCDHILLLFPDGELCFGPADTMLVPEVLERLYNQSLSVTTVNGKPVFVPA